MTIPAVTYNIARVKNGCLPEVLTEMVDLPWTNLPEFARVFNDQGAADQVLTELTREEGYRYYVRSVTIRKFSW